MTGTGADSRSDDHALLDELSQLARKLESFPWGILTNTLSVSEQLEFGYRLIRVAGLIRARVERQPGDPELPGVDGDAL